VVRMGNPVSDTLRDFGITDRPIEVQTLQGSLMAKRINKITKIVDKWHKERYDTDWDTLQGSLMKIYKLVHWLD